MKRTRNDAAHWVSVSSHPKLWLSRVIGERNADQATGSSPPTSSFSRQVARFVEAVEARNLEAAETWGATVRAVSLQRGWYEPAARVGVALGGMHLLAGSLAQANGHLLQAERAAKKAGDAQHAGASTCSQLHLQARLLRGQGMLVARAYRLAAPHLEQTALLAWSLGQDARLQFDGWLHASFGYQQLGELARSASCALEAVDVAERMSSLVIAARDVSVLTKTFHRLGRHPGLQPLVARVQPRLAMLRHAPGLGATKKPDRAGTSDDSCATWRVCACGTTSTGPWSAGPRTTPEGKPASRGEASSEFEQEGKEPSCG